MVHLKDMVKEFGDRRVFDCVNWRVRPGDKVGLAGENGAGKTTLLRMLAGQVESDGGALQIARGTTIGYLPQDGLEHRGRTLFQEVRSGPAVLIALETDLARLEAEVEQGADAATLARCEEVRDAFRMQGGMTLDADTARVLRGLGFPASDQDRPCEEFSGGWQMRIALARLLVQRPNLLLLDEPTNHLDLPARDWLETYLKSYPHTVILVSHDRWFLENVVSAIVEIWNGGLTEYPGNYSKYEAERDRRVATLHEAKARQDEEIARVQSFVDRFRYQANKASQVQSRVKQLEKIVRIDVPPMRKQILFKFPDPPPCGQPTLRLEGVEHGYGGLSVFHGVGLAVEKGERIALVGPNGAGKSTLMRVLSGGEAPRAGTRTEGNGLKIAYFAQDQAKVLSPGKTVLEEILAAAPMAMVPRVRDILGAFLFTGDDAHKPVSVLSGGERNRLALAILLLRPANLLLLDEPTNHLDLKSKDVLLKSLERYTGTIVFVSHDRHFVDHLATRVLEIGGGDVVSWPGNYEAFLAGKARVGDAGHQELRVEHRDVVRPGTPPPPSEERKQSYAERKEAVKAGLKRERRLAEALARIEEVEARFKEVEASMSDPVLYQDAPRWKEASEKYAALQDEVAKAWVAWEAIEAEANA